MTAQQTTIEGLEKWQKPDQKPDLLQLALSKDAAIDVIERLAVLQRDERAFAAEMAFNEAMNRAQHMIGRIAPDLKNKQTNSTYASYAQIDKIVRPIYTDLGFSLSFSTEPMPPEAEMVRVICYVSHTDGHTRKYMMDMPADGKGAKGGDVMTKTHARGAASQYAKRYLVKDIFNIAIGEDDNDGNLTMGWLAEKLDWIANCRDDKELSRIFQSAFNEAKEAEAAKAMLALVNAKDKRKAELQ